LQMVTKLRVSILDDIGGTGMDWASGDADLLLRWGNDELTGHINEAQKEAARRSKMFLDASFRINLVPGKSLYYRDPRIIQVRGASLASDNNDVEVNRSILDIQQYPDWETATGYPNILVNDYKPGQFFVFRQPTAVDVMNLIVYRYPMEDLDWDCRDTQDLEFHDQYAWPLLYMAASLAYLKDEVNTRDFEKSALYEAKFTEEFGPKESITSELQKGRRYPRDGAYGGLQIRSGGGGYLRGRNPYGWRNGRG